MREYDLIAIGTGSAMNLVGPFLRKNPTGRVAVIEKDEPGGICLTRGCIPTKLLTYPAELVRLVQRAHRFGIDVDFRGTDFEAIMRRMRSHIDPEIEQIRRGLQDSESIDFFAKPAHFVAPHTLQIEQEAIRSPLILLCAGSQPHIPPIEGLRDVPFHTSDTILHLERRPDEITIVGGGYIAAEFGHFFSAMGAKVTIIGRNPRLLPTEDPDVSDLARSMMSKHMRILTGHEVRAARRDGSAITLTVQGMDGPAYEVETPMLLVATGRSSLSELLQPEKGGIRTDRNGWIMVNDYLQTTSDGVWAFGDCIGKHQFKHAANYESSIVFRNAVLGERIPADYHAVPHAVFADPEVASVGLTEPQARLAYPHDLLVGRQLYRDTAKGSAMEAEDEFVKVLVQASTHRIVGAHIVGPHASILIQEIINLMYAKGGEADPLLEAMHIHPALPEVVERAFGRMRPAEG